MSWLTNLFANFRTKSEIRISVFLLPQEYAMLKAQASTSQLKPTNYARMLLLQACHEERQPLALEAEAQPGRKEPGAIAPLRQAKAGSLTGPLSGLASAPWVVDHSCVYLKEFFLRMGPSECFGACANSKNLGKECFWHSDAAHGCVHFERKKQNEKRADLTA